MEFRTDGTTELAQQVERIGMTCPTEVGERTDRYAPEGRMLVGATMELERAVVAPAL